MTTLIDRRAVLASIAGAAFVAPTFAAVEAADAALFVLVTEGKQWWDQVEAYAGLCDDSTAAKEAGLVVLPENRAKLKAAFAGYDDAFATAMQFVPSTVAGIRAKLEWADMEGETVVLPEELVKALTASLLASPALATER